MTHLFSPLTLRSITLRNRIGISPMCQYVCDTDGLATPWHLVHLGARATGGAGLVIAEASAVLPEGRITAHDLGIWNDQQAESLQSVTHFIRQQGSIPALQLAHAGSKASRKSPSQGTGDLSPEQGGWRVVGPSSQTFAPGFQVPRMLSEGDIAAIVAAFAAAASRALHAGFQAIEIHAAHGYLLHSFLSPLTNLRSDAYGGSFAARTRIVREVLRSVRKVWPDHLPLLLRISASDWAPGGWTLEDSLALARLAGSEGVDLIDCSSGGASAEAQIPVGANYQVPFAEAIRRQTELKSAAVGMISEPLQADAIIRNGQADLILLGRESLRDPQWPLRAAKILGYKAEGLIPRPYERAF